MGGFSKFFQRWKDLYEIHFSLLIRLVHVFNNKYVSPVTSFNNWLSDVIEIDLIQSIQVYQKLKFTKNVYASRIERKFAEQQQFAT